MAMNRVTKGALKTGTLSAAVLRVSLTVGVAVYCLFQCGDSHPDWSRIDLYGTCRTVFWLLLIVCLVALEKLPGHVLAVAFLGWELYQWMMTCHLIVEAKGMPLFVTVSAIAATSLLLSAIMGIGAISLIARRMIIPETTGR
jgi:pheromone shutdown protein TraB